MINVRCHYFGELGVHLLGRNFVRALSQYDEIALLPVEEPRWFSRQPREVRKQIDNANGRLDDNAGLAIGAADLARRAVGRPKILHTVFETTKIPAPILDHLAQVDEVWIPSTWGKAILAQNGVAEEKVHVVPEGVDVDLYKPEDHQPAPDDCRPFRFLCVGKWEVRKGIDILMRAFVEAFHPRESVEMVLHCHNPQIPHFSIHSALARLNLPPHASICVSNRLREPDMVKLYHSCDALVLPTRGEGWGLPIIEAMACAKPVIVTGYSAHLDYVTAQTGYLIRVERLVDVNDPLFFDPELDFGQWAQPDFEHLKTLMRHVFVNREEALAKGRLAREQIAASWTWNHAAERAWERLKHLRS